MQAQILDNVMDFLFDHYEHELEPNVKWYTREEDDAETTKAIDMLYKAAPDHRAACDVEWAFLTALGVHGKYEFRGH